MTPVDAAAVSGADMVNSLPKPGVFGQFLTPFYQPVVITMVLWYFPECKIVVISTSCAYISMAQNVGKSVKQCVRPLRFPWTSPM
jgi:hypothetical protein